MNECQIDSLPKLFHLLQMGKFLIPCRCKLYCYILGFNSVLEDAKYIWQPLNYLCVFVSRQDASTGPVGALFPLQLKMLRQRFTGNRSGAAHSYQMSCHISIGVYDCVVLFTHCSALILGL